MVGIETHNYIILDKEEKIAYCNLTVVCKRWNKDLLGGLYSECMLMLKWSFILMMKSL